MKGYRNRLLTLLLCAVLSLALTACGGAPESAETGKPETTEPVESAEPVEPGGAEDSGEAQTFKIRLGNSDSTGNLIQQSLEHFADAVKERTGGRVEIQIYAAEALGSNAEMLAQVEAGELDAMMLPSGQQAALCPKFKALSLPFLFSGYEHVHRVLDGEIGEELLQGLEDYNLIQLAYWENGLRQFTNNVRPILAPEDMEGLKFRVPDDDLSVAIFSAFGASAVPSDFAVLYLDLQQGTFDGQENPVANIVANNFQNVQRYLTIVNYQYQPKDMIFSLECWNQFPEDIQQILLDAAKEFGAEHREAVEDSEEEMLESLKAGGMQVDEPDTEPFVEKCRSVYEDFYRQYDWAEDLVARIQALDEEA